MFTELLIKHPPAVQLNHETARIELSTMNGSRLCRQRHGAFLAYLESNCFPSTKVPLQWYRTKSPVFTSLVQCSGTEQRSITTSSIGPGLPTMNVHFAKHRLKSKLTCILHRERPLFLAKMLSARNVFKSFQRREDQTPTALLQIQSEKERAAADAFQCQNVLPAGMLWTWTPEGVRHSCRGHTVSFSSLEWARLVYSWLVQ